MAITAGILSLVSVTYTSANLSATAATGGVGPYTYQWYRSTVGGFTPGPTNLVALATALTLSDTGLVAGTQYYYSLVATDTSDSTTVQYAQLAVATPATLRTSYSGAINTKLAQARQAGNDLIAVTNLADLIAKMGVAASHGQRNFTVNYPVTFQPADLRGNTACNTAALPANTAGYYSGSNLSSRCSCTGSVNKNGPLWPAFQSGMYAALYSQDIMENEVVVSLNTSDQLATSVDLVFTL